jgi:hypothetical protein
MQMVQPPLAMQMQAACYFQELPGTTALMVRALTDDNLGGEVMETT